MAGLIGLGNISELLQSQQDPLPADPVAQEVTPRETLQNVLDILRTGADIQEKNAKTEVQKENANLLADQRQQTRTGLISDVLRNLAKQRQELLKQKQRGTFLEPEQQPDALAKIFSPTVLPTGETSALLDVLRIAAAGQAPQAARVIESDIARQRDQAQKILSLEKEQQFKFNQGQIKQAQNIQETKNKLISDLFLAEQKSQLKREEEKAKAEQEKLKPKKITNVTQLGSPSQSFLIKIIDKSLTPKKKQQIIDKLRNATLPELERLGISESERVFIIDRVERSGDLLRQLQQAALLGGV